MLDDGLVHLGAPSKSYLPPPIDDHIKEVVGEVIHKKPKHFDLKDVSDYKPPEYDYLPPGVKDVQHHLKNVFDPNGHLLQTINIQNGKGDPHAVRFHQPGKILKK